MFGGGGTQRRRNGPAKGRDLQQSISISFNEAAFGTKKQIQISKFVVCHTCDGTGAEKGTSKTTCPKCNGTGEIIEHPCKECSGTGKVRKTVTISVDIPAGVDNDSVISIRGQGEPGTNGGPNGDFYVVVSVTPHKVFKRNGNDLILEMPISFTQLALGDDIIVPTLSEKISYKIPAGTQPDTVFRIKGKGIKSVRTGKMGDLYIKVDLEIPTKMNSDQRNKLKELADVLGHESYIKKSKFAETMKELFK